MGRGRSSSAKAASAAAAGEQSAREADAVRAVAVCSQKGGRYSTSPGSNTWDERQHPRR